MFKSPSPSHPSHPAFIAPSDRATISRRDTYLDEFPSSDESVSSDEESVSSSILDTRNINGNNFIIDSTGPASTADCACLASLPQDALLNILSHLPPSSLAAFSASSSLLRRTASSLHVSLLRHAFLCAAEIAAAWTMHERGDALELAKKYLGHGVPVYPGRGGSSDDELASLRWRMGLELQAEDQFDPFFAARISREDQGHAWNYVEEKSNYYREHKSSDNGSILPVTMRLHRHLDDQHCLDDTPFRKSPPINLNANFFHPTENGDSDSLPIDNTDVQVSESPSESPINGVTITTYDFSSISDSNALLSRFSLHRQLMESHLSCYDVSSYRSSLLDWWDELLPRTAGIHLYNGETAIPRDSKLPSFLTEPCPKDIGTIKCEVERVKVSRRKNGDVKGRLFPTYEYRLFIRDGLLDLHSNPSQSPRTRKDALLLVAKPKLQGQSSAPNSNDKRSNNYYLCLPQRSDIDSHHRITNTTPTPPSSSHVLGRLQSNLLGTEFQIFSPTNSTPPHPVQVEPPRKPNGFTRLARRASLDNIRVPNFRRRASMDAAPQCLPPPSRRMSLTSRTRRCSIAHEPDAEMEEGAITYTANLLGNRPRIMDVCIPKLVEGESRPSSLDTLHQFKSQSNDEDIIPLPSNALHLQNRPPWWNVELGAFVLNFGGRVSVASVKNFQLCERTDGENIMLQFGRIGGRHSFTMDFGWPLTPVQAFAIAVSSLQTKISFG